LWLIRKIRRRPLPFEEHPDLVGAIKDEKGTENGTDSIFLLVAYTEGDPSRPVIADRTMPPYD